MNFWNSDFFKLVRILTVAFRLYRRKIALMAGLNAASGILEGIGINAIIPLFSFIEGGPANDMISRSIKTTFEYLDFTYTVKYLLIFITVLFVVKAAILFWSKQITLNIVTDYERTISEDLFCRTLAGSWPYLSRQKIGHLDQVLTTDIKSASALLNRVSGLILVLVNLIVYGVVALNISFPIAMLALVSGGLIFFAFKPLFYKNRVASGEMARRYKELAHFVNETIIGVKGIKAMMAEEPVFRKGVEYFERMKGLRMHVGSLMNFTNVVVQPIGLFFVIGIFALFYKTSAFNFASFAVIVYAINRIFAGIQLAQSEAHVMSSYIPYAASVLQYQAEATQHHEEDTGTKRFLFKNQLEFRGVGFSYDGNGAGVSEIFFTAKKGAMTGLIGPSGAGKTTLVDLLLRLLRPQKGTILLDGTDIADIKIDEWRGNLSYVSQEMFLINDTIENNIRFYNGAVSREDVIEAAKMSNIYDFIQQQPQGFETVVGERGTRLSGGERQRIILARALARKPRILILDEATSALDNTSELLIQKAIEKLKGKMTVIVIAHRLSTVVNSDRLVVLENGHVIEQGAPADLLKDQQSYFFKAHNLRR